MFDLTFICAVVILQNVLIVMGVGTGGAERVAVPPTFGTGEQAIALAPPPQSFSLLHCDVRLSRIDLDI